MAKNNFSKKLLLTGVLVVAAVVACPVTRRKITAKTDRFKLDFKQREALIKQALLVADRK